MPSNAAQLHERCRRFVRAQRRGGRRPGEAGPRRGVAPLEFVMVLPLILALLVAILWLGLAVNAQSNVTVIARHKAWKHRETDVGRPFVFRSEPLVKESASQKVKFAPLFDSLPPAESSHALAVGAWDHSAEPWKRQPNWPLYSKLAKSNDAASLLSGLRGLEQLAGSFDFSTLVDEAIRDALMSYLPNFGMLGGIVERERSRAQEKIKAAKDQEQAKVDKLDAEINALETRATDNTTAQTTARDNITKTEKKLENPDLSDEDKKELENKLEGYKDELKRLEKEAPMIQKEKRDKEIERNQRKDGLSKAEKLNFNL